jgi:uncharacterized protein (DUF2141 family)
MKIVSALVILLLSLHTAAADSWKKIDTVFNPSGVTALSFSAPAFCDFDKDGVFDLLLGNSPTSRVAYFRNNGTAATAAFREDTSFLSSIYANGYVGTNADYPAAVDLDGDGRDELIIGGFNGILYYKNVADGSHPIWQQDTSLFRSINTMIGTDAKPAFADLDSDGDLDLLVGIGESLFGGPTAGITLGFRNTGTPTQPQFTPDNLLAAGIPDVGLNAYPAFADIDKNGKVELIMGRDTQTLLYFRNNGTQSNPVWTQTPGLVSSVESKTYWKNPTFCDIDGDLDLDMIYGTSDGTLYCYKNIGDPSAALFQYDPAYFQTIRTEGNGATVSFGDFDNDGDIDFISGDWLGKVQYFRNDGTSTNPRFVRATTSLGSIDAGSYSSPVFVDIDGDGDLDIVSGELNGKLYAYINNGGLFTQNPSIFAGINVGGRSAPAFADINGDGRPDMLVGAETAGNMQFYINSGSLTFTLDNSYITGIIASRDAHPVFADIDKDGDYDLVIGTSSGTIIYYENIGTPTKPVWQRADGLFRDVVVRQDATPAFADLDGDGRLDLVVGEYIGNFTYYKNMIPTSARFTPPSQPFSFLLKQNFPNPFNPATTIDFTLANAGNVSLTVHDLLGRKVAVLLDGHKDAGSHQVRWDASAFPTGVYFCRLHAGSSNAVKTMVLTK